MTEEMQTIKQHKYNGVELTILMPCLNEEKTLGSCIDEAMAYLDKAGCRGEVLIADNGSSDNSLSVARQHGARIAVCHEKGYGNALRFGLKKAYGRYVIFGDCDMSYDFFHIEEMHHRLKSGYDLVIGNRFAKTPARDAMPFSHRLGVPFLSWAGRLRYHCHIKDFHCGLRGCRREALNALKLTAPGMEFATEIIGKACDSGLKITQVPVILRPDGRDGKPHLRTVRDGFRHLFFIIKPLK
ncbi:MAG: glycosyltransferase family 2 protein [Clostridiales bacterium]|nr:glycosyltransferase family 2 protein [Clostridiales bacterium]